MANGDYDPSRNMRDYLDAKIDGNRDLSDATFKSQETAVNAALVAAEKAVNAALVASEKAITKAEAAQARVNEGQIEFRDTLKDLSTTMMPRNETELLLREIRSSISTLSEQIANLRSRIDVGPPSLGVLQARSDESVGRAQSGKETKVTFLAIASIVGGVIVFILEKLLK